MNKISDILKQKKGMTLVETIVTFIIAGILITATGALIITGLNLFNDTASRSLDKQIGDSVLEVVRNELLYVSYIEGVSITEGSLPEIDINEGAIFAGTSKTESAVNGRLYMIKPNHSTATDIFPNDEFYSGRKIGLHYELEATESLPIVLTVTVKIYHNEKLTYSRYQTITLLNITEDPENPGMDKLGRFLPDYQGGEIWPEGTLVVYMPGQ